MGQFGGTRDLLHGFVQQFPNEDQYIEGSEQHKLNFSIEDLPNGDSKQRLQASSGDGSPFQQNKVNRGLLFTEVLPGCNVVLGVA